MDQTGAGYANAAAWPRAPPPLVVDGSSGGTSRYQPLPQLQQPAEAGVSGGKRRTRRGGVRRRTAMKGLQLQRNDLVAGEMEALSGLERLQWQREQLDYMQLELENSLADIQQTLYTLNADSDRIKAQANADRQAQRDRKAQVAAEAPQPAVQAPKLVSFNPAASSFVPGSSPASAPQPSAPRPATPRLATPRLATPRPATPKAATPQLSPQPTGDRPGDSADIIESNDRANDADVEDDYDSDEIIYAVPIPKECQPVPWRSQSFSSALRPHTPPFMMTPSASPRIFTAPCSPSGPLCMSPAPQSPRPSTPSPCQTAHPLMVTVPHSPQSATPSPFQTAQPFMFSPPPSPRLFRSLPPMPLRSSQSPQPSSPSPRQTAQPLAFSPLTAPVVSSCISTFDHCQDVVETPQVALPAHQVNRPNLTITIPVACPLGPALQPASQPGPQPAPRPAPQPAPEPAQPKPKVAPKAAPKAAAKAAPKVTPKSIPKVTPKFTPKITPKVAPSSKPSTKTIARKFSSKSMFMASTASSATRAWLTNPAPSALACRSPALQAALLARSNRLTSRNTTPTPSGRYSRSPVPETQPSPSRTTTPKPTAAVSIDPQSSFAEPPFNPYAHFGSRGYDDDYSYGGSGPSYYSAEETNW